MDKVKNLINFPGELKHAFELSKPKIVFVSKEALKNVSAVCKNLPHVKKIILIDGKSPGIISIDEFMEKHSNNSFNVEEYVQKKVDLVEKTAVIFLSSGTTGAPKGNFSLKFQFTIFQLFYIRC